MYIERYLKMPLNNRKQISKNFVWTFQSTTLLKIKTAANHFAIKHLLLLKANQAAFLELQSLINSSCA